MELFVLRRVPSRSEPGSAPATSEMGESDRQRNGAEGLYEGGMLRIDLAYPVDDRRVVLRDMGGSLLHDFRREFGGHFRSHLRAPGRSAEIYPGGLHEPGDSSQAATAREQHIEQTGALRAIRVSEKLSYHLGKRRGVIRAEHRGEAIGEGRRRSSLGDLVEMICHLARIGGLATLGVVL
jgi:hypothetical protein